MNVIARPTVAWAPAKLNLFLEIVDRRADGFHELETLMLAVDLYDTLEFEPTPGSDIELSCSDLTLPTDARNLVHRAASKWNNGCRIRLSKRIPSQAGMGGGSSDAATTLAVMNRLFGDRPIAEWANELGSDVGFFLGGPAGWCTGRGEIVEPIAAPNPFHFVVVQPPVGCPTGDVYKRVERPLARKSGGLAKAGLLDGDVEKLASGLWNRLEEPACQVAPEVRAVRERLERSRPLKVQVTGSGSAVFAVARDRADAIRIADDYRNQSISDRIWVLRSITT